MKLFVMVVLGLTSFIANAQSISLLAGKSLSPADYFSLRYMHYSNSPFKLSFTSHIEKGTKHRLSYGSFGADLSLLFDPLIDDYQGRRGGITAGIGIGWQVDHEPWLYKDWSFAERSSFGLSSEIAYQYFLSGAFRIGIFGQQKILFNPRIGRYRCCFGLTLSHLLGN